MDMSHHHEALLLKATVLAKLWFALLFIVSVLLVRPFDSSHLLVPGSPLFRPLLRWDTFHFLHIAQHGYVFEHEWAFFPGVPFLLRRFDLLCSALRTVIAIAFMTAVSFETTRALYRLSLFHLGSESAALLAALLSLLPSSPITLLFAPYNEPFFTLLSYEGMLLCAQERWLGATLLFTLASIFRSNGIFLSVFILWGLIAQPLLARAKPPTLSVCLYSTFLTSIILSPFVFHNYTAFSLFCGDQGTRSAFCNSLPPSVYTYVQATYWNVGLFRYWTLSQVPNFVIALPPLLNMFTMSFCHLKECIRARPPSSARRNSSPSPFFNATLIPHTLYALALCCLLLFASHVQIVLRFAASIPLVYWGAARALIERPTWGRAWLKWSFTWSATSIILWSAFLPPA